MPPMHATDDALELYALDILVGADLESIEDHILVCPLCRSALDDVDLRIKVMRLALRQLELEKWKKTVKSRMDAGKLILFREITSS